MAAAIGTALPIMITEWNYAPNAVPNDGKNNDSNFMTTWTTKAIQTLAANRIFASMQYSCTDTAISLIGSNATLTMQGMAFQNQYQQMITDGHQPAPAPQPTAVTRQPQPTSPVSGSTPNSNPTIVLNSYQSFSFEDGGTDGWGGHGSQVTGVQNSTRLALSGTHALQVTLTNVANNDFPYVSGSKLANYPHAGQTLTAYVYLPSNSVSFAAKVFVMDSNYHWFSPNAMTSLTPGIWNRLTFMLPQAISGQPRSIGIQFNNLSSVATSSDVYIDAVSWS
jgi:hypothetical protein